MKKKKEVVGIVTSDKMDKTVSVAVEYLAKHPKYEKYVRRTTVLKAHDPENKCRMGDKVRIKESRPLSKTKRWRLVSVEREEK